MKKDKKQDKKKSTGRLRGFIGVVISLVLLLGAGVCKSLISGKKLFSFTVTGSLADRFDEDVALESKMQAEQFFVQGAKLYDSSEVGSKYSSYTLKGRMMYEESNQAGRPYTNAWKEVYANVDKDYTVYTVTEEVTYEFDYARTVREYVLCKTGTHAGELWTRSRSADESASDVGILEKGEWHEATTTVSNEMEMALSLLSQAKYSYYDAFNGQFEFSVVNEGKQGTGTFKPGLLPEVTFSYELNRGEYHEAATHSWECSFINATKAVVPQSLLDTLGGNA